MTNTKQWAASHGLCVDDVVLPVYDYVKAYHRTVEDVAIRTIILHCVAAVGYGVDPQPIIAWLKDLSVWEKVSPNEQNFLCANVPTDKERSDSRWRQEAQWALLWAIGKVEALGLPTQTCDTARLVDEIMPGLGDSIDHFVSAASLRPPAELLGEDDRTYNLHCHARKAFRDGSMPDDLVYDVLFQRHYAFEWLSGEEDWDNVTTDT
ncbi:DUF4272 domain-containing protein [Novipirellula sp.]|uniref:DUF4272 domain-containing protein n=1 Tax=Novipirellula sp. TaxID=2795430 RepID=UPI00356489C2